MRIDDIIYFAPGLKIIDLNITDKRQLLEGFKSRINSYYLNPIAKLNAQEEAFASGIILMTVIDAITYYSIGGSNRIREFIAQSGLIAHLDENNRRKVVKVFNDYFRDGLIHEGRIKSGCQFSYQYDFVCIEHGFLILNPHILHENVAEYFSIYLEKLAHDEEIYTDFYRKFVRQFNPEITQLKRFYS